MPVPVPVGMEESLLDPLGAAALPIMVPMSVWSAAVMKPSRLRS
jgi:hypothetical protein